MYKKYAGSRSSIRFFFLLQKQSIFITVLNELTWLASLFVSYVKQEWRSYLSSDNFQACLIFGLYLQRKSVSIQNSFTKLGKNKFRRQQWLTTSKNIFFKEFEIMNHHMMMWDYWKIKIKFPSKTGHCGGFFYIKRKRHSMTFWCCN